MKKTSTRLLITFSLIIATTFGAFCQAQKNTANEDMNMVFTREEIKPSFKSGADSLNIYLTQNVDVSQSSRNEKSDVRFIVSSKGNVYDVIGISGNQDFVNALRSALLKSSGLWNSGIQNGHHINAYCMLKVVLHKKMIQAEIK